MLRALLASLALASPAPAQGIERADYPAVARDALAIVDFEILPPRAEPGYSVDHGIVFAGGRMGTGFAGQRMGDENGFDRLGGQPFGPLTLVTGPARRGLSVATHRGFGSMAVYPLGPAGFPALEARGEGSIAVLFDEDICQVGMRVHSDYPDPLGAYVTARGEVLLTAYGREGTRLGQLSFHLPLGMSAHGLRSADSRSTIAGLTLENSDPGGIAIDDLAYGPCAQTLG